MGNLIDKEINKQIFMPPNTNLHDFNYLNTDRSKIVCINVSGYTLPILHITPVYNLNPQKYIVFAHGNSSDLCIMYNMFTQYCDKLGVGIIAFDYIGYGLSKHTKPTEKLCYVSMEHTMAYVLHNLHISASNIYLAGQSLGTGVIVEYAVNHAWTNPIILVSPYTSIFRIANVPHIFRFLDKFKTIDKIHKLTCAVKIIHGEKDELISITHAHELYNKLPIKTLKPIWYSNAGHGNIFDYVAFNELSDVFNYNQLE